MSGVCQGVQGACPRQAVTSAEVTVERRDVGTGLKLVYYNNREVNLFFYVCYAGKYAVQLV